MPSCKTLSMNVVFSYWEWLARAIWSEVFGWGFYNTRDESLVTCLSSSCSEISMKWWLEPQSYLVILRMEAHVLKIMEQKNRWNLAFLMWSFHANPGLSHLHFFFFCENKALACLSYHSYISVTTSYTKFIHPIRENNKIITLLGAVLKYHLFGSKPSGNYFAANYPLKFPFLFWPVPEKLMILPESRILNL